MNLCGKVNLAEQSPESLTIFDSIGLAAHSEYLAESSLVAVHPSNRPQLLRSLMEDEESIGLGCEGGGQGEEVGWNLIHDNDVCKLVQQVTQIGRLSDAEHA